MIVVNLKPIIRKINASKKRIAKERDKLRDIIDEAESIEETCKVAFDDLEHSADELSQYL